MALQRLFVAAGFALRIVPADMEGLSWLHFSLLAWVTVGATVGLVVRLIASFKKAAAAQVRSHGTELSARWWVLRAVRSLAWGVAVAVPFSLGMLLLMGASEGALMKPLLISMVYRVCAVSTLILVSAHLWRSRRNGQRAVHGFEKRADRRERGLARMTE